MTAIKNLFKKNSILRNMYSRFNKYLVPILVKISPVLATKYIYFNPMERRKLDLKNPKYLSEKIQWLKLYWQHPLVVKCADKYEVRQYVRDCGCEEILNELYGVYDHVSEIDWALLPKSFVLKINNGSGTNIICKNKRELNKNEVFSKLNRWIKIDSGLRYAEIHYSKIKPRIICEKYIEPDEGLSLNDYKIYCFNGKPEFIIFFSKENRNKGKLGIYDLQWKPIDLAKDSYAKSYNDTKPKSLNEMVQIAARLAKPFPFVRIDFYDVKGKPIFGEMTFTPLGGFLYLFKEEVSLELGKKVILPEKYIP